MKTILLTILICILSVRISDAQWVQVNYGLPVTSSIIMASGGNNLYGKTGGDAVYLSTNIGTNCSFSGVPGLLAVYGNNVFYDLTGDNFIDLSGLILADNNTYNFISCESPCLCPSCP